MEFQVISKIHKSLKKLLFQVLGDKEIYVPTHLFKIVILKISDNFSWKYWLESYVITNINLNELFVEKQGTN